MVRKALGYAAGAVLLVSTFGCGAMGKAGEADTATPTPTHVPVTEVVDIEPVADEAMGITVVHGNETVEVGPTATPTPEPTPSPTPEPTPEEPEALPPVEMTGQTLEALAAWEYSPEDLAAIQEFYSNSVFCGDSVLVGFKNYCARSSDPIMSELGFLAAGSLSLHNSFWEVSSRSVHPLYQGQQYPIWESISMMGADRVFLFFGINDVAFGVQASADLYPQVVDKIHELSPDAEINIISTTYTIKNGGQGGINNERIREFNELVKQLARDNGWGYVDLAPLLSDGQGNLKNEYCSDGFLHETNKAYEVWRLAVLRYGADRLGIPGPDTAGNAGAVTEDVQEEEAQAEETPAVPVEAPAE